MANPGDNSDMRLPQCLFLSLLFVSGSAVAAPVTYDIDSAQSKAQFSVRHLMINTVTGEFSKVSGSVVYDDANLSTSKIDATIDASTISTQVAKRDAHLRSADFFDVGRYPAIRFVSKEFRKAGSDLLIRGDLTMHGITREVTLKTTEAPKPDNVIATTRISRKDWDLTWNKILEGGGLTVSDEVEITLRIKLRPRNPGGSATDG